MNKFWSAIKLDKKLVVSIINNDITDAAKGIFFSHNDGVLYFAEDGSVDPDARMRDIKKVYVNCIQASEEAPGVKVEVVSKLQSKSKTLFAPDSFRDYLEQKDDFFGLRDTKDEVYLPFKNTMVIVRADSVSFEPLGKRHFFKSAFIKDSNGNPRDYIKTESNGIIEKFCEHLSGNDPLRMKSLKSAIAFLCTNHKKRSYCPAIILTDEVDAINPQGRTGKSLIGELCSYFRKRLFIKGKTMDKSDKFFYQSLKEDHSFIHIDDILDGFDFELFFSEITGGVNTEAKFKASIEIPFERSPKYLITTNKEVRGLGSSHDDRKFEFEVSSFFSPTNRPEQVFGLELFTGFDDAEWSRTDNFIIDCIQLYLREGLVKCPPGANKAIKKFKRNTSDDFYLFCENYFEEGTNFYADNIKQAWLDQSPRSKVTNNILYEWVRMYADLKGWVRTIDLEHVVKHDNKAQRYFLFGEAKNKLAEQFKNNKTSNVIDI